MRERAPRRLRPRATSRADIGSERDARVLGDLAALGMLTTGQIERLHFPSRRRAQRRLRAYLDAGLARAHLQGEAMHRDNVWTLSPLGLDFLKERGAVSADARLDRPRVRSQKLAHALLVREIAVALFGAERAGCLRVRDLRLDNDLANEPLMRSAGLVPDGYAELEVGRTARFILWEAVSTKQPFSQVLSKLTAYERAAASGLELFRDARLDFVFVLESVPRLERLRTALRDSILEERFLLLPAEGVHDGSLVARLGEHGGGFRPLS